MAISTTASFNNLQMLVRNAARSTRGHSTSFSQSSRTSSRDQIEAMLASQMAAVHIAAMTFARRLANVDTISQQDSAERAFTKLLRTFATQMEALKRYRTGGEQKVTVQHVSVGEGGQAIVGNVNQAPREGPPSKATAPAALNDSSSTAMPIIQAKQRTDV